LLSDKKKAMLSARLARLSPREREVMEHVVRGEPNKAIAAQLGISEKTVKVHRQRVMAKMEATSLPDLVRLAGAAPPRASGDGPPSGHRPG
jgi:FixJ family two-component response regulator